MRGNPDLRRVLGAIFVVAAFGFLGAFVARNLAEVRAYPWSVRPALLAASVALNIGALAWGAWVWGPVLRALGARAPFPALARVWFLSALGRYIPGKVWQFVGVAHLSGSLGIAPATAVTSLALHTGFFLVGAAFTAVYLIPPQVGDLGGIDLDVLRWGAPLLLLLVHPALVRGALRSLSRVAPRPLSEWTGGWKEGLALLLLAIVGWLLNGAALYLFLASLVPLPPDSLLGVIGVNALAFLVGYAVFVAPAGLGAKEGALAALLSLYLPVPVAAVLAVASRLWSVVAEVLPALALLRLRTAGAPPDAARAPR